MSSVYHPFCENHNNHKILRSNKSVFSRSICVLSVPSPSAKIIVIIKFSVPINQCSPVQSVSSVYHPFCENHNNHKIQRSNKSVFSRSICVLCVPSPSTTFLKENHFHPQKPYFSASNYHYVPFSKTSWL